MKKVILVLCALVVSVNAQATSKSELSGLVERIDNELRYYNQSPEALNIAKQKLEEALTALRGTTAVDPQVCFDYAFDEFKKDGYSNSSSLDKAKNVCIKMNNQNTTLGILSYFYSRVNLDGYSVPAAFEHALNISLGISENQMTCVDTAFGRYKQDGYSVKTSLEKAANFCRN